MALRLLVVLSFIISHLSFSVAQIKIGGNVYGGGNQGNVGGSTNVRVRGGDLNKVFGGARMANVGGNSFVNIDGEHAISFMLINYLFGGNDIAGTIGTAQAIGEPMPTELAGNTDGVDNTWNTYVHISSKTTVTGEGVRALAEEDADAKKLFIGQLFAGGNGDYYYRSEEVGEDSTRHIISMEENGTAIATVVTPKDHDGFTVPELDKTYLDIQGGTIFFAHGGGNNVTVKEKAVIHVDNPSKVVTEINVNEPTGLEDDADGTNILTDDRIKQYMGIRTAQEHVESEDFQIGRLFGGNNKAEMAIRPTWSLQSGKIRNLYSGGNRGNMTSPEGLLLELDPKVPAGANYEDSLYIQHRLIVDNVYGGCRMADVMPTVDGVYTPCTNLLGYSFPDQLSARVLVRGGDVNNVYGGNDVTGTVYGGNAIGIYTTVRGDVYGGGNGAYAYTDNEAEYKNHEAYGDFYYSTEGYLTTTDALNDFRPNAEQVSIRLAGTNALHPTIIKGSVFCGGNCATLKNTTKTDPMVELKIGSHVIADKVFLGNNGEKMVDESILQHYAGVYPGAPGFSSLSSMKTDASLFASYMDGVVMKLQPSIVFDDTNNGDPANYVDYTSKIGSFFCGGNVGSMAISGKSNYLVDRGLVIFEKFVAGCNNADVKESDYNPAYEGGILGSVEERDDYTEGSKMKDRIELNLDNLIIEPRRWNDTFEPITAEDLDDGNKLKAGQEYYTSNLRTTKFIADGTEDAIDLAAANKYYKLTAAGNKLEWNTAKWSVAEDEFIATDSTTTGDDRARRLLGGNVYGGCYNSGHVNGNVTININQDLIKRNWVFGQTDGIDEYTISGDRRSGVLREAQGDDVMAVAMTVFGAGYGENTEIWGSTTVNLNNGYCFQIFGGGEEGVVGKKNGEDYEYNAAYSTTVNLKGENPGYSEKESGLPLAETEYIYGGGSEGDVCGNSYVYLGNGRIYDAFGGASNADIYGATEVHIGYNGGFPWIKDNVYGGNDFGGTIKGKLNHTTATPRTAFDPQMLQSSTYVRYIQGRVDSIFGGCYGSYDYSDRIFKDYTDANGLPLLDDEDNPEFYFPHLDYNPFVHFQPEENSNNKVSYIFGGSEGFPGNSNLNNSMHKNTYVLIDDTKTKDVNRFANVDIYGGGAYAGVGTATIHGAGRTAVDMFAGSFHNVYGGCNQEGLVGYTRVNVPSGSTVQVNALFGGGKGYHPNLFDSQPELTSRYCDNYLTCVDYQSANAIVKDAIYGGNENSRISCDTYVNIGAEVKQPSGYQATVYGAGYGKETVSGRTNVFMNNHSNAYKVFGGGRDGNAFNFASLREWLGRQFLAGGTPIAEIEDTVTAYGNILRDFSIYLATNPINLPTNIGTYVNESTKEYDGTYTNDIMTNPDYHQTNVHIMNGGNVSGYAYGGGYGEDAVVGGTTYLELKGGNVDKDIYGGGQGGPVYDEFGLKTFTATTNVYIEGGMARNVYGGGYLGHVGRHYKTVADEKVDAAINEAGTDIPAIANVIIGKVDGTSFYNGIPAIKRNVYGGGEGGSVYGTANLTINNGYVGYRYKNTATSGAPVYKYVEELDDQKPNAIEKAGNAFGGGYVVNSYVDTANVTMLGGYIRGSLYGGGEVGPIGRGTMKDGATGGISNGKATIYKAGKTLVKMYDGHVLRNVFGGGRGHDSWGGDGTMYMDEALKPTLDLKCKGYVFGQTEVNIYGGEIGTDEGVAQGYGNVFGGGDIGCVYSAYEKPDGTLCMGKKPTGSLRYDDADEGYYYKYENGAFVDDGGGEKILTEDCKVLVEPWCKATADVEIHGITYDKGTYVPTDTLNYLGNKEDAAWSSLGKEDVNKEGIIIHNAVFAGGNTSPGSTEVYANTTTVFGNATASIHDVYNRDLISIGRGRVGGLYGDGNLTLVDGYREVNITNYGTDYYHINPEITIEQYRALPNREAAYYEIRYKCLIQCQDKNHKTYVVGSTITADEMINVFDGVTVGTPAQSMIQPDGKPLSTYWKENGVCSRYAGRPMNTVQRADFCGVFGSRMVMQGAQDRVPEVVDYTNYTINRVREVSLNKKVSVRSGDAGDAKNKEHGNYFGIYSVVNFLGALTSDVDFHTAVRVTDNSDATTYQAEAKGKAYGTATYYDWKDQFHNERKRNNGNSHNKVALASGVYLELTSEKSTGKGLYEKDWGLITGVVELDLINVQPGMGGGYVYAKNAHGIRSKTGKDQTILTALNKGAVSNKHFQYDETEETKKEWETSGNFVHSTQTIIDDCYNIGAKYHSRYNKPDGVPAHYWFIKGAVYIYDQYISAYTGNPNAFSEEVSIPLTITSASHGKMTLMNVMPNHYAYYSVNTASTKTPLGENDKIELRDKEYGRNDAINYWDYSQLTDAEKKLFVDSTYVVIADCKLGDVTYEAGTILLPSEYKSLKAAAPIKDFDELDGLDIYTPYVHHISREQDVDFDYIFRLSNNVSHNTGYILTYTIDNPNQWNTWYTPKSGDSYTDKKNSEEIKVLTPSDYEDGPTYTPNTTGLYGQNDYSVGNIISKDEYDTYQDVVTNHSSVIPSGQATFHEAYIVTAELLECTNKNGTEQRLHKGATLAKEDYIIYNTDGSVQDDSKWTAISGSVALAYVVNSTVQLSKTEFIYRNTYMTEAEKTTLYNRYKDGTEAEKKIAADINKSVVPAYYCTEAGKYGGNYYEEGKNYRALAAYSAMSESDRANFTFNYDALDLLIDPNYRYAERNKYQYDGEGFDSEEDARNNKATYSLQTPIDYSATYKGASLTYIDDNNNEQTATNGTELSRTEYERLPNEQYYWAPITVVNTDDTYYVVKETIVLGDTPYAAGQVITNDSYEGLGDTDRLKVAKLKFTSTGTYYYCREAYTILNNADGHAVTSATGVTGGTGSTDHEYAKNTEVPTGVVITDVTYNTLTNKQKNFSIHGLAPTETSTLYVARGSDIFDLSAEKIITVIYQYDYVESDMAGTHITPVSERHVLNIHLNFKSGIPTVEDIQKPDIIIPGTTIIIPEPYVTPGAYEITGGGWKLFDTETDAESHINGIEYTPSEDPLYLYQNKHYLAYYAKTYLGETYSNHVPVSVANYHDLKKVMDDKQHHYYIDHKDVHERLKVEPKIYINDYSSSSQNGLDLFKNLYDLSLLTNESAGVTAGKVTAEGALENHYLLNKNRVGAGKNLEFFLRTDLSHNDNPAVANEWTPIASGSDPCFEGTLHGDGHTITGLDNSLFEKLCGDIYNLGVTGSFTSAGIAETGDGYMENCWMSTTSTAAKTSKPIYGAPDNAPTGRTLNMVNCYYQEEDDATNKYTNHTDGDGHGVPTRKTARAFYNGEVAYDLNGFYLYKRYSDKQVNSGAAYRYYTIGEENALTLQPAKHYASNPSFCSAGYTPADPGEGYVAPMYVEDRFADGDFRYAGGNIPEEADERLYIDTEDENKEKFFPIWPDDYLFFGQRLTYGYAIEAHQDVPSAITKNNGRLSQNNDANRVYRAPAYFRSKEMGVTHFNPHVYLAQKSSDGTKEAYPNMTAIDFAGHYDTHNSSTTLPYQLGLNDNKFYAPLLDDDGLKSITNYDETKNLLVYAPADKASNSEDGYVNKATYDVLTDYFIEPEYSDYYDNTAGYRKVSECTSSVYGHLVNAKKNATNDHLLVDKEDFNAPIAYDFDKDSRMWYQRKPEDHEFVNRVKGWQGISIPFTAELVTTNDKGEITHFYSGSETSKNGTESKIGHEYWLREFTGIKAVEGEEPVVAKASFLYPESGDDDNKTVTNTFLWDYYYKNTELHNHKDKNKDTYQTYYNESRKYNKYPLLGNGTPYIIGLPGQLYYEFDLSGNFLAQNAATYIDKIGKQLITFASNTGISIDVSDDETEAKKKKDTYGGNDYTFKPSYMNMELEAGTNSYALDYDGEHYTKVPTAGDATKVSAFRPYFTASAAAPARYIDFESITDGFNEEFESDDTGNGSLIISSRLHHIIVKSTLKEPKLVTITNGAGIRLTTFLINPGQTVDTNVHIPGFYIVNKTKIAVR